MHENTKPQEVFFILKGTIINATTLKIFPEGAMIGETDIVFGKRTRTESYLAKEDSFILKLSADVFERILSEYPNIKEKVYNVAKDREEMRLKQKRTSLLSTE